MNKLWTFICGLFCVGVLMAIHAAAKEWRTGANENTGSVRGTATSTKGGDAKCR